MSKFLTALEDATNYTLTENGGITHKTTKSDLLDMFALGAAMRNRSDADIILMWRKAFAENPAYALKCLFYIRDVRGGQGERRFFRLCIHDLANSNPEAMSKNIENIPYYGRWDDLYSLIDTPVENTMWKFLIHQLALDVKSTTPSLLAKWLKSENASSAETKRLARITRRNIGMTSREYRKTLSILRQRINVLERLMSAGKWDEIEFDKIPSKAGFIYRNAFARHDVERMRENTKIQSYADFVRDDTKTVNTKDLYPYEIVGNAVNLTWRSYWTHSKASIDETQRIAINKYWDNFMRTLDEFKFNGLAVVDTSGSMVGSDLSAPINVAISLGMCCAEKAVGPFHGKYISFSSRPQLIPVEGIDFVDTVRRIYETNLCENTNIRGVFDLLLNTARANHCSQEDLPENIIIISDMEFDRAAGAGWRDTFPSFTRSNVDTELEKIADEWAAYGYKLPKLVFWNVDARQNNIPMLDSGRVSYVSGMSPSIYQSIATGKTGYDLMMDKLNSERYSKVIY